MHSLKTELVDIPYLLMGSSMDGWIGLSMDRSAFSELFLQEAKTGIRYEGWLKQL